VFVCRHACRLFASLPERDNGTVRARPSGLGIPDSFNSSRSSPTGQERADSVISVCAFRSRGKARARYQVLTGKWLVQVREVVQGSTRALVPVPVSEFQCSALAFLLEDVSGAPAKRATLRTSRLSMLTLGNNLAHCSGSTNSMKLGSLLTT
jgi:hypothetical protein